MLLLSLSFKNVSSLAVDLCEKGRITQPHRCSRILSVGRCLPEGQEDPPSSHCSSCLWDLGAREGCGCRKSPLALRVPGLTGSCGRSLRPGKIGLSLSFQMADPQHLGAGALAL